jgi:hypothetical protein
VSGAKLEGLSVSLIRTGVIVGRVSDRNGEPVRARVQALRRTYGDGKAAFTVLAEVPTNDLGEYRLHGLTPGGYVVGATQYGYLRIQSGTYSGLNPLILDARFSFADAPRDVVNLTQGGEFIEAAAIRGEVNSTQYFSNSSDPTTAQLVIVQPGANIRTDIQLLPSARPRAPGVSVRGQVIDGPSGQPVTAGYVQLGLPERSFAMDSLSRMVSPDAKGEFVIDKVDPGEYVILASNPVGMSELIGLSVGSTGVNNVRIVLNPRVDVAGRIYVEGSPASIDFTKIGVLLQGSTTSRQIVAKADGTFSTPNLWPGNYRLALTESVSNVFLKSAKVGDTDVLSGGLSTTTPPGQPLELIVSVNTGTLEGVVFERDQRPAAAVRVVLIPDLARRSHYEKYRATTSDSAGRFRLEGIAPGEYTVFAWENIEENAWQVPEILRAYENQGKVVRVREGGRETVNVQIIDR